MNDHDRYEDQKQDDRDSERLAAQREADRLRREFEINTTHKIRDNPEALRILHGLEDKRLWQEIMGQKGTTEEPVLPGEKPVRGMVRAATKIPAVKDIPTIKWERISITGLSDKVLKKAKKAAARLLASNPNNLEANKFNTLYKEIAEIEAKDFYLFVILNEKLPEGERLKLHPDLSSIEPKFIATYNERKSELMQIKGEKERLLKETIKKLI